MQASDVAHTMQHWHVYLKWNARLFNEMYRAYKEGRLEKDPTEFWYNGEIRFFDYYIIPLAQKLKSCGAFGVSRQIPDVLQSKPCRMGRERGSLGRAAGLGRGALSCIRGMVKWICFF
jgi:hypothetical protein